MRRRLNRVAFGLIVATLLAVAAPAGAADIYEEGSRLFEADDAAGAARLWRLAAERGDAMSQYRLAQLYEEGKGVPQSFIQAHIWYNLAAAGGIGPARVARDALGGRMPPDQIGLAQEMAFNWRPNRSAPPVPIAAPESPAAAAMSRESMTAIKDYGALPDPVSGAVCRSSNC